MVKLMIDFRKLKSLIHAVIFDMDGVLIDSYKMHKKAWNSVSINYGFTLNDVEFKKNIRFDRF